MIRMKNLSKIYRTEEIETTAVNDIDLVIEKGEFVAIMGPSGCGKSTLTNIIGMIDSPSSGSYEFDGTEVSHLSESELTDIRKANVGFIFQNFNLIDELTVRENVELPLLYQQITKKQRDERVDEALARMNMAHRSGHLPGKLSGGQQQRVAVARAIVAKPGLILADEPTGNLDSENGAEVMASLSELHREGTTIVMVTHSKRDAEYADRIVNVLDGRIIAEQLAAA